MNVLEFPPELLYYTLNFLQPNELKKLARVCKVFYFVIENYYYEPLCVSSWPKDLSPMSRYIHFSGQKICGAMGNVRAIDFKCKHATIGIFPSSKKSCLVATQKKIYTVNLEDQSFEEQDQSGTVVKVYENKIFIKQDEGITLFDMHDEKILKHFPDEQRFNHSSMIATNEKIYIGTNGAQMAVIPFQGKAYDLDCEKSGNIVKIHAQKSSLFTICHLENESYVTKWDLRTDIRQVPLRLLYEVTSVEISFENEPIFAGFRLEAFHRTGRFQIMAEYMETGVGAIEHIKAVPGKVITINEFGDLCIWNRNFECLFKRKVKKEIGAVCILGNRLILSVKGGIRYWFFDPEKKGKRAQKKRRINHDG